jgi:NitT/TauT family transport system permease protein
MVNERGFVASLWFSVGPIATVLALLLVVWYAGAIWLNAPQVIERVLSSQPGWAFTDLARLTWSMDRPVLPAPHQIALDLYDSMVNWPLDSPRNLLFHAAVTSSATLLGFAMGTALGAVLAVLIVHSRTWTAACSRGSSRRRRCRCWRLRRSSS